MKSTTNVFSKGLVTDLHPLSVGQDQLTDALNATFITYNGNELLLQNDMGNTRIQDRVTGSLMGLREGFIPLCMREHGGILYIASYNPFTKESELGSIPSPLFSYTQSTPLEPDDHNNASLFKIQNDKIYIQQNPLILSNLLFNVGDGIVCGLNIQNGNTSIVRTTKETEKKFPTISTLNSSGLITLHLLTIPSDTGIYIDLLQHQLSNKQGNIEQWFYDLPTVPDTKNTIQYPNFKSGRLAIKPELLQIENIQILQNQSTLLPEPYYTQISLNVVLFTYTKYNVKYSFTGSLKNLQRITEIQLDADAVLPILVFIDHLNQNNLELKSNQITTVSFLNKLTFLISQSVDSIMDRTILINGKKISLDANNLYTLTNSHGTIQIEDIPSVWRQVNDRYVNTFVPGIEIK